MNNDQVESREFMIIREILKPKSRILYLNNRKVEVVKRLCFRLAKVHYTEEEKCFYIDENLLTENKQNDVTICLKYFKGV